MCSDDGNYLVTCRPLGYWMRCYWASSNGTLILLLRCLTAWRAPTHSLAVCVATSHPLPVHCAAARYV